MLLDNCISPAPQLRRAATSAASQAAQCGGMAALPRAMRACNARVCFTMRYTQNGKAMRFGQFPSVNNAATTGLVMAHLTHVLCLPMPQTESNFKYQAQGTAHDS